MAFLFYLYRHIQAISIDCNLAGFSKHFFNSRTNNLMKSLSRNVLSNQSGPHDDLTAIVAKHLNSEFKRPIADHNIAAYKTSIARVNKANIIFDSGCGNGKSTSIIAARHPEAYVIGIDKSDHRINKHEQLSATINPREANFHIVRADLIDFWRLASNDKIKLYKHFILYPNPWPKKHHIKRRWHGSPLFKQILQLGGELELRSNWDIYLEEFAMALEQAFTYHNSATAIKPTTKPLTTTKFITTTKLISTNTSGSISDFEAKYHDSGHALWQLNAQLDVDTI